MAERLRWRLWSWLSNRRGVCPSQAHSRIIWRVRYTPLRIDSTCRSDAARNGTCWCGKVKAK